MLALGRGKARDEGLDIQWIERDVSDLNGGPLRSDLRAEGYDLVTCATALVLLADPRAAVRGWVSNFLFFSLFLSSRVSGMLSLPFSADVHEGD